jgi:hypothetical protein
VLFTVHRRAGLKRDDLKSNRHCERSEAIQKPLEIVWIASSLSLLAMTAKAVIEPKITLQASCGFTSGRVP